MAQSGLLKIIGFWLMFSLWGVVPAWANLADARAALKAGDYAQASVLAQGIVQTHPYDAAMITARSQMELGRYEAALTAARQAQVTRPSDSAARALEGLILLRQGKPGLAMLSLRRALDLAQTPEQKFIARNLIRQAKAARVWQVQGGIGLTPSSNLNKATTAETITVLIPGTDITAETEFSGGQAISGTGVRLFGQASRRWGARGQGGLSFGISALHTDDTALRQQSAQMGLDWQIGMSQVGVRHAHTWAGGDRYATTTTLSFGHNVALSRTKALRFEAQIADQLRWDDRGKDNTTTGVSMRYTHAPRPNLIWRLGAGIDVRASNSAFVAAQHIHVQAGARTVLGNGAWALDGEVSLGWGQWDGQAPLEPLPRQDVSATLRVNAQNNNISFYGLTPTYGISLHRRTSNLPRHDIKSVDLFLGLANAF